MHTKEQIFETIKEILVADFEFDAAQLTLDARLVEDLDLDSIDAVDLIVRLQKVVKTKAAPEDFKQIRTLQDMVDAIEKIVNSNSATNN